MKINRFNQTNESLYIGGVWNKDKMIKIANMKHEINEEEQELESLLYDFLLLNPNILDIGNTKIDYVSSYQYESFFGDQLFFKFVNDEEDTYDGSLNKIHFDEFMEFLKDPKTYEEARKYNL